MIRIHYEKPEYLNICSQTITIDCFSNYEIIVIDNTRRL